MARTVNEQSIKSIDAIAKELLIPFSNLGDGERVEHSADTAYSAIVWSPGFTRLCLQDSRFPQDGVSLKESNDAGDPDSDVNDIGTDESFRLGFDFAMELAARVAIDPLGTHDLAAIIESFRERYLDHVRQRRDQVWLKRRAAEKEMVPA